MKLQQVLSRVRKAVEDFNMIEEGDKIAIGISGGKDSLTLLYAMSYLRKFYPKKFDVIGVAVDVGFGNINFDKIQELCDELEVEFHVVKTEIAKIVFDIREESNPCSLCAKMRKGALNDAVKKLGCNKVAFGHHKDDLVETMMMSLIFEGRLHTFSPVTFWERSGITLIRPLLYMYEGEVKGFVREKNLPVVKSPCPVDGSTKREYAKDLVNQINREHPGAKGKMYRAAMNGLAIPDSPTYKGGKV